MGVRNVCEIDYKELGRVHPNRMLLVAEVVYLIAFLKIAREGERERERERGH